MTESRAIALDNEQVTVVDLPPEEASKFIDVAKSSSQYQAFIKKVESEYAGIFTLDGDNCRATETFSHKRKEKGQVNVVIPLSGGAGYSGLVLSFAPNSTTIILDANKNIIITKGVVLVKTRL